MDVKIKRKFLYSFLSRYYNGPMLKYLLAAAVIFASCVHRPDPAPVPREIDYTPAPPLYRLSIAVLEDDAMNLKQSAVSITIDDVCYGHLPFSGYFPAAVMQVVLGSEQRPDYSFRLRLEDDESRQIRYPQYAKPGFPVLEPLGVFECGRSPKQAHFSPCGRYVYLVLLDDAGFQVFDLKTRRLSQTFGPEKYASKKGFVEGLFIAERNTFVFSQMTSGKLFEYDVSDPWKPRFLRELDTSGRWSKLVALSPDGRILAVSNWTSHDVSLIDYDSGRLLRRIDGLREPRGLAFSPDGRYLYISTFLGGEVFKIRTDNWQQAAVLELDGTAMRHLVLNRDGSRLYASDLRFAGVMEIDTADMRVLRRWQMYRNTNTIALCPDDRYLYVSDRGPNNPAGYLLKSLQPGRVSVIDLDKGEITAAWAGGTQPTGLDVSPCGSYLVSSNFQDHSFDLFRIVPVP